MIYIIQGNLYMLNSKEAAKLKVNLLSHGINFDRNLFSNYKKPFYDNQFVYGQSSIGITKKDILPQVILLGGDVNCAILRRENSDYNLVIEGDDFKIYYKDKLITDIGLPERPAYFDKRLSDGIMAQNIIAVAGENTPGFFFYPDCVLFSKGVPCSFCSLKSTRKEHGSHLLKQFTAEQIEESVSMIEDTPWRDTPIYFITTGTCGEDEYEKEIIMPVKAIYDAMKIKRNIHLLAYPPEDSMLLEKIRDAGVTTISFNLEVYNRDKFATLCKGKEQYYGYDKWINLLFQAKEIWGKYKVFSGLIWGLEEAEDTAAGNRFFAENGIAVTSNIFHSDPKSLLPNYPHPTVDSILYIAEELGKLYDKYPDMPTIFDVSMRGTIDWEIKNGLYK